jgi:AcrR family transcriptional regulator
MGRWEPGAAGRLREAALALFDEHGYDATTVAEIAERAGLTKRTFFRHFADKREVLFSGSEELQALFVRAVVEAPSTAGPLEAVAAGLDAAAGTFEGRREPAAWRGRIIACTPELQERELIKLASLAAAVAEALRERGVGASASVLAAEAGITVFRVGFDRWTAPEAHGSLADVMRESLDELRSLVA